MNDLLTTLYRIQKETGFAPNKKRSKTKGDVPLNAFERQRKRVAEEIKNIRSTLKDRDELLGKSTGGNKTTVELSATIREQLKVVKSDAEKLQQLQMEQAKKMTKKRGKGKKKAEGNAQEQQEYIEHTQEIVDLAFEHIKECERLEKRRAGAAQFLGDDDSDGGAEMHEVPSALPDIDDDGEIGEKFALLRRKDAEIDKGIEEIGEGVAVLRQIAEEQAKEADVQSAMLTELDSQVTENLEKTENLNKRLKGLLESTRSGHRFIMDFICIILLLMLVGAIVSFFV